MRKPLTAFIASFLAVCLFLPDASAQEASSVSELKSLSIEELMNIQVTLVSRTPQKLTQAASAIQVITGETIRRSGATNLPEALRLVPNVQVSQLFSNSWIIGTRGFNTTFANKLLVMIDGRTVYTPLFGGVIWALQQVLLEDVDRIEVISGPGGTLWGANAVNGVINIVTKSSEETQGAYVSAALGSFVKDQFEARYGGKAGKKMYYKVYGLHFDRKDLTKSDGTSNMDDWGLTQAGFRMDWKPTEEDAVTLQGDFYGGDRNTLPQHSPMNGQNVLGRWTRTFSDRSDMTLQLYYDRYFSDDKPSTGTDKMNTADADFQYRFPIKKYQDIVCGVGYRFVRDDARYSTAFLGILPPHKNLDLLTTFIQDEVSLSNKLKFTFGTKLLNNVYTGLEWQPSARIAWNTTKNSMLWGAVSRAVRTPSRFDRDYYLPTYPVPPPNPSVAGGPNFISEKLFAYEIGYRAQPTQSSTFSLAAFYNVYRDLYSVEALPNTLTYQIQNGSEGETWGFEFSGTYQVSDAWRLRGGYSFLSKDLRPKPGHVDDPAYLSNDAKNRVMVQSMLNLGKYFTFDLVGRYVSSLEKTIATNEIPAYFTFDARLAWVTKYIETSITGQNLTEKEHMEYGIVPVLRGIIFKIAARF